MLEPLPSAKMAWVVTTHAILDFTIAVFSLHSGIFLLTHHVLANFKCCHMYDVCKEAISDLMSRSVVGDK